MSTTPCEIDWLAPLSPSALTTACHVNIHLVSLCHVLLAIFGILAIGVIWLSPPLAKQRRHYEVAFNLVRYRKVLGGRHGEMKCCSGTVGLEGGYVQKGTRPHLALLLEL